MLRPHPLLKELADSMSRASDLAQPWEGTVYRTTSTQYATRADLVTGAGSARHGGRWNPPGIHAVYACLEAENALAEALAHARYYGIPDSEAMPLTTAACAVKLQAVLDLADARLRRRLKLTLQSLFAGDWHAQNDGGRQTLAQAVSQAAHDAGMEAILVPSALRHRRRRSRRTNIVVFPRKLHTGSILGPLKPHLLPHRR